MKIEYGAKPIEKLCTDLRAARRHYNAKISEALHATINFIENATSLADVISYPPFHFHALTGDRNGQYAIDIAGRSSGYRLVIVPLKDGGDRCTNAEVFGDCATKIVIVLVAEVTNHYA